MNLGRTGISPTGKNPPLPPAKRPPGKKCPRANKRDIFYCSGSRQLTHSSFTCDRSFTNRLAVDLSYPSACVRSSCRSCRREQSLIHVTFCSGWLTARERHKFFKFPAPCTAHVETPCHGTAARVCCGAGARGDDRGARDSCPSLLGMRETSSASLTRKIVTHTHTHNFIHHNRKHNYTIIHNSTRKK